MNKSYENNLTEIPLEYSMLSRFAERYATWHGWLSAFMCILGLIFNSFNVIILRKLSEANMAKINTILISIAISDSILMTSYLPYSTYTYIIKSNLERSSDDDSLVWPIFSMIHMVISVTSHAISIWLTVFLAFYRYVFMSKSVNNIKYSNVSRGPASSINSIRFNSEKKIHKFILDKCNMFIGLICGFCLFICSPVYAYPLFKYTSLNFGHNNNLLFNMMFYSQAIMVKVIPCCLLVTFISMLINQLITIKRNYKKFESNKVITLI